MEEDKMIRVDKTTHDLITSIQHQLSIQLCADLSKGDTVKALAQQWRETNG